MNHHTQITDKERGEISVLGRTGMLQKDIAAFLGKHPSSISRELKRNKNSGKYHAGKAKIKLKKRRKKAKCKSRKITGSLRRKVIYRLKKFWSPEQIAGRLQKDAGEQVICHETIYQFIYEYRPDLKKYLRCQKGKYKRRYGSKQKEKEREEAKLRRIDTRPAIVEERARIGDWEGDTVVGEQHKNGLLTHVDRKSGFLLADKINSWKGEHVREITVSRFSKLPKDKRRTCTYDNGVEFSQHELIGRLTMMAIFFAYPYRSWERATNENTNGLLRQFFPKKTSLAKITQEDIEKVVKLINNRPRKRLDYLSPSEVFNCDSS
jgi:transposase, IS30 family